MKLLIQNGLILQNQNFYYKDVLVEDGYIKEIGPHLEVEDDCEIFDAKEQLISPGFIDIHTHGAVGVDSNHITPEGLEKMSQFYATKGVTSWLLSLVTDSSEVMVKSSKEVANYLDEKNRTESLLGIHMEGPFISKEYKGAQPEQYVVGFNQKLVEDVIQVTNGKLKYITVAPETKDVLASFDYLKEQGVVISLGHSSADYEISKKAIEKGARTVTHTFNGMRLFHQHEPGLMGAVLESNDLFYELICDGRHLSPHTINMMIHLKGTDKLVCVTDSIMATGLPDGEYILGANEVVVIDGDAQLKSDHSRAGSTLTLQQALLNLIQYTDLSIGQILPMFTENPAKAIHIDDEYGAIEVGKKANLVQLNHEGVVLNTWIEGKNIYKK